MHGCFHKWRVQVVEGRGAEKTVLARGRTCSCSKASLERQKVGQSWRTKGRGKTRLSCFALFISSVNTLQTTPKSPHVYERGFSFFSLKRAMRATPDTCGGTQGGIPEEDTAAQETDTQTESSKNQVKF